MQLNKNNLYVKKHNKGFSILIEMPDSSRNYLHTEPMSYMHNACAIKVSLEELQLNDENTWIVRDDSYMRIHCKLKYGKNRIMEFHSRQLNDNDAAAEFEMLVY